MIGNRRIIWNTSMWTQQFGFFMSVTLQATVHLGRDYSLKLRSVKNQSSKSAEHSFRTTEKLIKEQTEITGLSTIYWDQPMWRESSPLCDRAVHIMKSKTCVFADSVLCLGRHHSRTSSTKNWIKLTANRCNASGEVSQDSLHWEFSMRLQRWWRN